MISESAGAGEGKTRLVPPVVEVDLKVPLVSGEPVGIKLLAASSSVTFRVLMVEPFDTPANGTSAAPVGPTSSRSVCAMSLELMLLSETVTLPTVPRPVTKMFDG